MGADHRDVRLPAASALPLPASSPNSSLYPVLVFAGAASGITISTANSAYLAHELAHQISEASAVLILVASEIAGVARDAVKELGMSEDLIYVLPGVDGNIVTGGLKSYLELRGEEAAPVKIPEDELTSRAACKLRPLGG